MFARRYSKPVFTVVGLATILTALACPGSAKDVASIYKQWDEYKSVYEAYTFPPPEKLLDEAAFARYAKKIKDGQCNSALLELAEAFAEKHPEAPHPIVEAKWGLMAWHLVIVPKHYPKPSLCHRAHELEARQREIETTNLDAPRFPQQRSRGVAFSSLPRPVWLRDLAVKAIVSLALNDYAPALLALAKLSNEGKVLRLTPGYLYFALSRAKRAGLEDPELGRLYAKAQGALSDAERARLAPRIESGVWPRAEALLMD